MEGFTGVARDNKASQAIQSPRRGPFFILISLLDGNSVANVHVKGIVEFTNCDLDINHNH